MSLGRNISGNAFSDPEMPPEKDVRENPPDPAAADIGAMPPLAKPFAAFGAAAGLFAILGIGAFRDAAREVVPLVPMILTAGVGALAGETLCRWRRLHAPDLARDSLIVSMGVVTGAAGAISGSLVGLVTWGFDGVARFMLGGAVVGLAFLPSCLVVFDAAKRAARGRLGSLVAETDRRTVSSTVLAGIAFASMTQVPALLNANTSKALPPLFQALLSVLVSLVATVAIVALQRKDQRSRSALEAHVKEAAWLERASEDGEALPVPTSAVDLGLGADRWTRPDANYRTSGRPDVVLRGSVERAIAAFDECSLRRHRSLIVAVSGLAAATVACALRFEAFR